MSDKKPLSMSQENLTKDFTNEEEFVLAKIASAIQPVQPPAHLRERVMATINNSSATMRSLHTIPDIEGYWHELKPGVEVKLLHLDLLSRSRCFLMKLEPGAQWEGHSHRRNEECIVVEGEATIGEYHVRKGDFHFAPRGAKHGVTRTDTGALLYLRAGISDTLLSPANAFSYIKGLVKYKFGSRQTPN